MLDVPDTDFEELVSEALDEIPSGLHDAIDNVAVVVDHRSPPSNLLGLYHGVPLTRRGNRATGSPDVITIFHAAIAAQAETPEEIRRLVRRVVIHEVGHYFGLSDDRLHELGW
jgi:predicted Zn-dependent protease with MMP-like domain